MLSRDLLELESETQKKELILESLEARFLKKKKNQDIMVCILWLFSRQSTTSLEPSGLWSPVLNFGARRESLLWKSLLEKSRGLLKLAKLRVHRLNHLD